jgi:uncharacterized protein (DUF697 family)
MVDETPEPLPQATPGWKTTEFWATVAASLITILNQAFNWHIPPETITQIVAGIAAYVLGRSVVKLKQQ